MPTPAGASTGSSDRSARGASISAQGADSERSARTTALGAATTLSVQSLAEHDASPRNDDDHDGGSAPASNRSQREQRSPVVKAVIYMLLAVMTTLCLMPFAWLIRSSLMGTEQIFAYPPQWIPDPVEWGNFTGALTSAPFARYALNTLLLVVLIVPGALLSSSAAAFAFSRLAWRGRNVCFALLMSGLMLPYAATLIPTFIGWQSLGLTNTYWPLALPAWFAVGAAFNIFMLRQFFSQMPADLDNAMYVDGGTPWTVFWRIAIPLNRGPLTLVGIFTTIAVWNDLLNPLIYLSDPAKFTLSLGLASFRSLYTSQWGYLMAASLLVILPIMVLFAVAQKAIMENLALSGLKG